MRLRPVLHEARRLGAFVCIDMEQYPQKDITLLCLKRLLMEPELRDWPDIGIAIQAYLRDTEADLRGLIEWARTRGAPVTVRLVRGDILGPRDRGRRAARLARPGVDAQVADRRLLRALPGPFAAASSGHRDRGRDAQCAEHRTRHGAVRGARTAPGPDRVPDAARHGAGAGRGAADPGPAPAGVFTLRRDPAGHGLSGTAAPRRHLQPILPAHEPDGPPLARAAPGLAARLWPEPRVATGASRRRGIRTDGGKRALHQ